MRLKLACLGMQGPSKMLEDSRGDDTEQILPSLPQACADALAAELRVWRLHSEISELALLTDRLFSAPEVRIKYQHLKDTCSSRIPLLSRCHVTDVSAEDLAASVV